MGRNYCPISRLDLYDHFGEDDKEEAIDLRSERSVGLDLVRPDLQTRRKSRQRFYRAQLVWVAR
jgi:hypothetical protein